ncbi:MAG: Chromosomal replication initiator protein DnaA [Bacteroidetes bacterium ADurb.Bin123]|jgi:chromosomal replication initiator protein|nr:MAG: Chromosomal replication initiator protein DnaA [Bacteroidetes bacterium ADurb.Bin123]
MNISIYAIPGLMIKNPTDIIDRAVCNVWNISQDRLREKTRKREVVEARQTAMYFYRKKSTYSLKEIGALLGNFDHATVIYGCRNVKNLVETDKVFFEKFERVKRQMIE